MAKKVNFLAHYTAQAVELGINQTKEKKSFMFINLRI